MSGPRKIKILQKLAKEGELVTVILDVKREGEKMTGVRFDGKFTYQGSPYDSATKGWGYYLLLNSIASNLPLDRIRLFSKELRIKREFGEISLLSFTNSCTRGTLLNPKIVGREKCYGLAPEYAEPRQNFPSRIVEVSL